MTIEELLARESIRQTMVNYNMAGDRLRTEEFVANFTEDGVLESDGVPEPDRFRHAGKAELRAWMNRWGEASTGGDASGEARPTQAKFIRHHLSTCHIELTSATTARTRTYWVAYTDIGEDHGGYYLDDYEKHGDRWLIKRRRVRLDWRSPDSLYMSAVTRTNG